MVDRDAVGAWCKENGFELKECDGDGYDDGYEPKLWNGGWQTTSKKTVLLDAQRIAEMRFSRKTLETKDIRSLKCLKT